MNWPPIPFYIDTSPVPPGPPIDRRVLVRNSLLALLAVALFVTGGMLGRQAARHVAPIIVEWQIDTIDRRSEAPPPPELPEPPIPR